jgi:hypothetical protein
MPIPFWSKWQNFLKSGGWARLLILGFAIALTSCTSSPKAPVTQPSPTQSSPNQASPTELPLAPKETPNSSINTSIPFQILPVGHSPLSTQFVAEPQLLLFQNHQDWSNFWNSNASPETNVKKTTVPSVNFSRQQAIAVTLGSRPTGGFSIQIDQIEHLKTLQSQEWVIHYTERVPGADCFVTQQTTAPTIFLLTAPSDAPIRMQGKTLTDSCNS